MYTVKHLTDFMYSQDICIDKKIHNILIWKGSWGFPMTKNCHLVFNICFDSCFGNSFQTPLISLLSAVVASSYSQISTGIINDTNTIYHLVNRDRIMLLLGILRENSVPLKEEKTKPDNAVRIFSFQVSWGAFNQKLRYRWPPTYDHSTYNF